MDNEGAPRFVSADLTAGQLNALVKVVGGSEVVREILEGNRKIETQVVSPIRFTFTVSVNYDLSDVEAMSVAGLGWDLFEVEVSEFKHPFDPKLVMPKFEKPAGKSGLEKVTISLFNFRRRVHLESVAQRMDPWGYEPTDLWQLCALSSCPEIKNESKVFATGSSNYYQFLKNNRWAPYLCDGKTIGLRKWNDDTSARSLFAGVKIK